MAAILLGSLVKDAVSGFTGVTIAKHQYLYGCTRFTVQPLVNEDGALPVTQTFDEPQLIVIEPRHVDAVITAAQNPGGPEKYIPSARPEGKR